MKNQIEDFPSELIIDEDILNFYSPDFLLHLDINKKDKTF